MANEVPLSPAAVSILSAAPLAGDGYDFPSSMRSGRSVSGFSKAKARLDKRIAAELAEDQTNGTMPPWRLHDLRRSAASGMAQLGIAPHVIEKVLNHVSGSLAGVYNRFGYSGEKRHALESWAARLQAAIDRPLQLVPMHDRMRSAGELRGGIRVRSPTGRLRMALPASISAD